MNCGIQALQQMKDLKNVSMYTLLHLAKDNGLDLRFCKVDEKDLPLVHRPAIFHLEDSHFIFMENGKALPKGKYSGFVLTQKTLGMVMPHNVAKTVHGGKGGGGFISSIITAVATIINPWLGAATAAGVAAHQTTGGAMGGGDEARTKGEFWRIPMSAGAAYVGGGGLEGAGKTATKAGLGASWGAGGTSAAMAAGALKAGEEIPYATRTGDWGAPISAGLSGYGGSKMQGGFKEGWGAGDTLGKKLAGGFKGMLGIGASEAAGAAGTTPAGYTGSVTVPGVGASVPIGQAATVASQFGGGALDAAGAAGGKANAATGGGWIGKTAASMGFDPANIKNIGKYIPGLMSMGAEPPTKDLAGASKDVGESYNLLQTYLGDSVLPQATEEQLSKYVGMSFEDLAKELDYGSDRTVRLIEEKGELRKENMKGIFARSGQNEQTSSELRDEIAKIDQETTMMLDESQQEIRNATMRDAIQAKQFYLSNSLEQNQYNSDVAMELARLAGRDAELEQAVQNDDYDAFQGVMAELLQMGWSAVT